MEEFVPRSCLISPDFGLKTPLFANITPDHLSSAQNPLGINLGMTRPCPKSAALLLAPSPLPGTVGGYCANTMQILKQNTDQNAIV